MKVIDKLNQKLCNYLENIASVAILLIMFITCVDVVGAKIFKWRLLGAIDIVMLSQIIAISFSGGTTLLLGKHISVVFLIEKMPLKIRRTISAVVSFILVLFIIILIWRLSILTVNFLKSGEHSATAYIPYYPFTLAMGIGFIPFLLTFFLRFIKELRKGEGDGSG